MNKKLSIINLIGVFIGIFFTNTKVAVAHKTDAPTPKPTRTLPWLIPTTHVDLSFNWKEKTADGIAYLKATPYFFEQDSLVLDAKGMFIKDVKVGLENAKYQFRNDQIVVYFKDVKKRFDTIAIKIEYTTQTYLHESNGSAAITDDRGLYFINTDSAVVGKPSQIWTQGETESNSRWFPCIDHPNSRTVFSIKMKVPKNATTLSNGILVKSTLENDFKYDEWKSTHPIQVYAIMLAVGDFVRVDDTPFEDIPVSYYFEPKYAPYAKQIFGNTPEMLQFFSTITGVKYPWEKYSQIVVRDYVSGAMENTSASLFGPMLNLDERNLADGNWDDIIAHELFHQWFGDYVTAESWSHLTVNESFANYGEYLWRRYKYGINDADEHMFRDFKHYLFSPSQHQKKLVRFEYNTPDDMFDRVSYQKGGAILRYWHHLLGDTAFYNAMQLYLTTNALQSVEATHWRLAVEKVTGQDWTWFFNQFYLLEGHPQLQVQHDYDHKQKKLLVTIEQKSGHNYQLPIDGYVYNGVEKKGFRWFLDSAKHIFEIPYSDDALLIVVLDSANVIPGNITEIKPNEVWVTQFQYSNTYAVQRRVLENIDFRNLKNEYLQKIISLGLQNNKSSIRLAVIQKLLQFGSNPMIAKWIPDLEWIVAEETNNKVKSEAIDLLAKNKWKVDEATLVNLVNEQSYFVSSNALSYLVERFPEKGYEVAKKMFQTNIRSNTALGSEVISTIAKKGNIADTALILKWANPKNDSMFNFRGTNGGDMLRIFAINTFDTLGYQFARNQFDILYENSEAEVYKSDLLNELKVLSKNDFSFNKKTKREEKITAEQKSILKNYINQFSIQMEGQGVQKKHKK